MAQKPILSTPALTDSSTAIASTAWVQGQNYAPESLVKTLCQGRPTLTSGVAVTTSDVTAAANVYWTPYRGNQIGLYNGSAWDSITFSEITISLASGFVTNKNYDVFGYNNSGSLALETLAWTSDSARATALVLQDGVSSKSGVLTRRYLFTFRTVTATTTEDSEFRRFLWANDNRVQRSLYKSDGTSHTIGSTNFVGQYFNSNSANKLEFVLGLAEDAVLISGGGAMNVTGGQYGYVGIGLDGPTLDVTYVVGSGYFGASSDLVKRFTPGYHFLALVEGSGGAGTTVQLDAGTGLAMIRM
jgi:hypothetical protein